MPEAADPPTTADRALLQALRSWSGDDHDRVWAKLAPEWRSRLANASGPIRKLAPEAAWDVLRHDHIASARPDPARVHPSWFVRALKPESPAVRRAVAANAPDSIREGLRKGLGIPPRDMAVDREPDKDALDWALAFWTERLVGDLPDRPDDPPVVLALTTLPARELARLVKAAGLAKFAFSFGGYRPPPDVEANVRLTNRDRVRLGSFRRHVGQADPRLVPQAKADVTSIREGDARRAMARLGLITFGRLLAGAESHRARWALQHIPYSIARLMRDRNPSKIPARALVAWEGWVLDAAWTRLLAEGMLKGTRRGCL